ncbi:MAG: thiamine pyrophosphate-binding protein [Alphaproteobacteria bacterium]
MPGNPRHLIEDLHAHTSIKFVLVRNEPSAVACAYAYARISGRPGVCFSNPGPGITNLATGLLEAASGSVPVIAIANGVVDAHDGMGAFQELDAMALMRPVTKWATRITTPSKTPWVMERAFHLATSGRPGPAFIEVPSDIGLLPAEIPDYARLPVAARTRPAARDVAATAKIIAAAKRPLMLCGSGAVSSGAAAEVQRLSELAGMPVFVTAGGRGVIGEDADLFLGLVGLYFTEVGKAYYFDADLLLTVGTRLEAFSTNSWQSRPKGAKLVQLDVDAGTIGMNWRPDAALIGDAACGLADLRDALEPLVDKAARDARVTKITDAQRAHQAAVEADAARHCTPIRARQVVAAVNRIFDHDTILVKENGGADLWCYYWPYYRVLDVGDCVPMAEQTAMGMGVTGTIGAKLAHPNKKVVCFAGDGAMQMAMMELATAAEWNCGITWIVLNNRALGWVQYTQVLRGQDHVATDFKVSPDFAAIARAQGCNGMTVTRPEEVDDTVAAAREANEAGVPCLIDVAIEKHDYHPHFIDVHRGKVES